MDDVGGIIALAVCIVVIACLVSGIAALIEGVSAAPLLWLPAIGAVCFFAAGGFYLFRKAQALQPAAGQPPPSVLSPIQINTLLEEAIVEAKAHHPALKRYLAAIRAYMQFVGSRVDYQTAKRQVTGSLRIVIETLPNLETPTSPLLGASDLRYGTFEFVQAAKPVPMTHPLRKEMQDAFDEVCRRPLPLPYDYDQRFSHMVITGSNKSGKSTLLKRLILSDLQLRRPPSLVIVDTHSDLTDYVARLDIFHPEHGAMRDKLIIFHPDDPPPAINIFHSSTRKQEHTAEAVIESLQYMFTGLDVDLSGPQGILFQGCVRFLMTLPNPTLRDFIRLLEEPTPQEYLDAVERLPNEEIRGFMEGSFKSAYSDTKRSLRNRLDGIQIAGAVGRLFRARQTRIDLFEALNTGHVILVDASQDALKSNAPRYGRFFIGLVLQAIFERASITPQYRKPTFLYCDESQYWFDQNTKTLLTDARKFKLGGVFAHHGLSDLSKELRDYLMGETAIRMVGNAFTADETALANALHAKPEMITQKPRFHFTTWIDGMAAPVHASVDASIVESQKQMDEDAYQELRRLNRERIGIKEAPEPVQATPVDKIFVPQPIEPKRKRPKKHRPLVGDIDTSA